jgi:hypothetical protein
MFPGSRVKRESTLNISKKNSIFINFEMPFRERIGGIYSNSKGRTLIEIVVIIDTSMET